MWIFLRPSLSIKLALITIFYSGPSHGDTWFIAYCLRSHQQNCVIIWSWSLYVYRRGRQKMSDPRGRQQWQRGSIYIALGSSTTSIKVNDTRRIREPRLARIFSWIIKITSRRSRYDVWAFDAQKQAQEILGGPISSDIPTRRAREKFYSQFLFLFPCIIDLRTITFSPIFLDFILFYCVNKINSKHKHCTEMNIFLLFSPQSFPIPTAWTFILSSPPSFSIYYPFEFMVKIHGAVKKLRNSDP